MREKEYISLIHRSLTDQLSVGETDELNKWIALDIQNQEIYSETIEAWEVANGYDLPVNVNIDQAFDKFRISMDTQSTTTLIGSPTRTPVRRLWPTIASIAAVGLLLIGLFGVWKTTQSNDADLVETTATSPRTMITLPDQSVITLNEGAKVSYRTDFDPRQIQLDGEAFFDVTKNPEKPFTILTKNTATTVLGTSFNIKNEATKTTVTVFTGKVSFVDRAGKNQSLTLTPKDRGVFNKNHQTLDKQTEIDLNAIHWQKETLTFQDQTISELLPSLETFYGISIKLSEPTLGNCTYTGSFNRKSLKNGLESLSFGMDLTFTQNKNRILLKGEGCPKTPQ
jgi:Fe2+-dicitrate sensor, membrane component